MQNLGLKQRVVLLVSVLLIIAIASIVMVTANVSRNSALEAGYNFANSELHSYAKTVKQDLDKSFTLTRSMGMAVENAVVRNEVGRDLLITFVETTLKANAGLFGTWLTMDDGPFDGKNDEFKTKNGHDKKGVFTPYYTRSGDQINSDIGGDPEYDVSITYKEDFYAIPYNEQRPIITEPYDWELSDKTIIPMVSTAVPILLDGKSIGVAGIDIALTGIQNELKKVTPYGVGYAILSSAQGNIVSHPDSNKLGKQLSKVGFSSDAMNIFTSKTVASGTVMIDGVKSYVTSTPLSFGGSKEAWHFSLVIPNTAITSDADGLVKLVISIGVLAIVIGLVVAWVTGTGLARPVIKMADSMTAMADGNLDVEVPKASEQTEIGMMAKAMELFRQNAIQNKELQEQTKHLEAEAERKRKAALTEMADHFDQEVQGIVRSVHEASTHLQKLAEGMSTAAKGVGTSAENASNASFEISQNVDQVAAASEELSSSVDEISRQVNHAQDASTNAASMSKDASENIQSLSDRVSEISEVLGLITDIANQTNLLALNATIEAARAGDAGKGFAVVASEVKNLASQTAQATEQIGTQIGAVVAATDETVQGFTRINTAISDVQETSTVIAAAIEEQGAATREIANSASTTAQNVSLVSSTVSEVKDGAQSNAGRAQQVLTSSQELEKQAESLRKTLRSFLNNLRES